MRRKSIATCIIAATGLSVCACNQSTQVESTETQMATDAITKVPTEEEEEVFTEIRYRDGKAALFRLGDEWPEEEREIVLDGFTRISDPFDEMAYVWTEDEKEGIICWDDMIVEVEYTDVAYEMYLDKEDIEGYVFRCQKEDGYDVVFWEFNSGMVWKN